MSKLMRLNMTDRSVSIEELPERYQHLGGRGLTSTIIYDEVDPLCHPLGPNNKLVFGLGIVAGTAAPTSSRISVGAKSPLTGGIKEANAGSPFPPALAALGVRALVVEGQPQDDKYWLAYISWDGDAPKVEFLPADEYVGRDLYEVFPELYERFGKVSIAGIGVAGEFRYANSGIVFDDMEGRPARYAGRGGLGAVMGSKGLKFIIVNRKGAPGV
ncbi:MAG TPA: aldehyde ferredoxin oxidoreductase, partial [Anaerolineae bacterium]|nr:aldehyde ferredoxin oxidoreductase [Anaerolineae bacterium]